MQADYRMRCLKDTGFVLLALFVTMATSESESPLTPPPLPEITSISVETSEWNAGASISVKYKAPQRPTALWMVDGLPLPEERRVDYTVYNSYSPVLDGSGETTLTSAHNKWSQFGLCLLDTVGDLCLTLRTLPVQGTTSENPHFPWPLMTPGPLVRYNHGNLLRIHAPVMEVPAHVNYTYSATLFSKNPHYSHGRLVQASSRGMDGGVAGDVVQVKQWSGSSGGWLVTVATDRADYEGVLMMNTTYRPASGVVESCSLYRPFTVHLRSNSAPFPPGFVAALPPSLTSPRGACVEHMACPVICPFLSNGPVTVVISRRQINSVLNAEVAELFPPEPEEVKATVRMFGPFMGYGYYFIPNFRALRDTGTYQCQYSSNVTRAFGEVQVM